MQHIAICTYRVKKGQEQPFLAQLRKHWPTLHSLGLVEKEHHAIFQGAEEGGNPFFVEILPWIDARSPDLAEQHPEVIAIWEPMGKMCEARGGRPPMEFPHVDLIAAES